MTPPVPRWMTARPKTGYYGQSKSRMRAYSFNGCNKLAKPNYQFAKRQKEIAKKKKQEEKQKRRSAKNESEPAEGANPLPTDRGER